MYFPDVFMEDLVEERVILREAFVPSSSTNESSENDSMPEPNRGQHDASLRDMFTAAQTLRRAVDNE